MKRELFVVICALIAFSTSSVIQPYDLVKEAEKQLNQLKTLVQDRITLADDDIQDLYNDFRQYAKDEESDSNTAIQKQYQIIKTQIAQVKTVAKAAGKNVSSCTRTREITIQQLSTTHINQIDACIDDVLAAGLRNTREAKYLVAIVMNKVLRLERELKSCKGQLLCVSPLVTRIKLYQVSLIQEIRTEVSAVDGLLSTRKLAAETCSNQGISAFIMRGGTIFRELTECVNKILG